MSIFFAGYDLHGGYIHNWLVAGPQAIPLPDLERFARDDFELQIARYYHQASSSIYRQPVEWDTFTLDAAS